MNRQEHILTVLAEEGVEVAKDVSKALRFGLDDKLTMNPDGPRGTEGKTNAEKIRDEAIDFLGVYQMAVDEGLLPDLGLNRLPVPIVDAMRAKAARVESFMRYARRVDALASLPKLSELACFRGIADMPFRVLVEGPQGYSHNAAAMTMEALIRGFTKSGRSVFPPALTDEAIAGVSDPMPVYAVHPDYNLADPPILTLFPKDRTADGYLVQWPDGTTDRAHAEHLIPVFPPKDYVEADTDPAIEAGWAAVPAHLKIPPVPLRGLDALAGPFGERCTGPDECPECAADKARRLRELGVGPFPTDPSNLVFPTIAGADHPNNPKVAPGLGVWQFRTDAWSRPTWELFAMEEPKEDASDVPILARVQQRDRPALWSWEAWANPLTTGTESGTIPLGVPDGAEAGRIAAVEALIRSRSGKGLGSPVAPIGPNDDLPLGKVELADPIADIPGTIPGRNLTWTFSFRSDGAPCWNLVNPLDPPDQIINRRAATVWQVSPDVWNLQTFEGLGMSGHESTDEKARAGAERAVIIK